MGTDLKKGSNPAIQPEQWVNEHSDALFRYAYSRVGDRDSAEDLVQDTFLAALQEYEGFQGRCTLRTWLISILRHKIAEHYRQSTQQPVRSSAVESEGHDFFEDGQWKEMPAKWSSEPQKEAGRQEFWEIFLRCIRRLSPSLADAFILREMEFMDSNEICSQLNISETGLWSRLHRARLNLRDCLEKNWFT